MVQPIPRLSGVTSYLILRDAARAIDFYEKAFGAQEVLRLPAPDGTVAHAERRDRRRPSHDVRRKVGWATGALRRSAARPSA